MNILIERDLTEVDYKKFKKYKNEVKRLSKDFNKHTEEKKNLEKILIIGPYGFLGCHVSEHLFKQFKRLGFDVKSIAPRDLKLNELQRQQKQEYNLSILLQELQPWKPDLIFIDECNVYFSNTQPVPVIYHHREFKRPPKVNYPNMVLFWHEDIKKYFEEIKIEKAL